MRMTFRKLILDLMTSWRKIELKSFRKVMWCQVITGVAQREVIPFIDDENVEEDPAQFIPEAHVVPIPQVTEYLD